MTKFEDQLFQELMSEHGRHLRAPQQPAPSRRRARPVWLASGAVGVAGAVTAVVMALGSSAPAMAAYSVTGRPGDVSVSVDSSSGVAGANGALQAMRARVVVVPVRPGCPPIGSLPRPNPAPHPSVRVAAGLNKQGQRVVSVKIKGSIPKGDTMILAFTGGRGHSMGAGGIITGPVPHCVSLPGAPPGSTGAVTNGG